MDQCDDTGEEARLAEQCRQREARRLLGPENYQLQPVVSRCQQGPSLLGFQEDPEILNVLRTSRVLCVHTTNRTKHCEATVRLQTQCNPWGLSV